MSDIPYRFAMLKICYMNGVSMFAMKVSTIGGTGLGLCSQPKSEKEGYSSRTILFGAGMSMRVS